MPNGWGNKLKEIREKEGITRSRLAQIAEISDRTISRIERQKRHAKLLTMNKIIHALNEISAGKYTLEDVFPNK